MPRIAFLQSAAPVFLFVNRLIGQLLRFAYPSRISAFKYHYRAHEVAHIPPQVSIYIIFKSSFARTLRANIDCHSWQISCRFAAISIAQRRKYRAHEAAHISSFNSSAPVRTLSGRTTKTYSFTEAALSAERANTSVAAAETQAKYTGESIVAGTKIAAKMHAPFTIGERIFIVLSLFTAFFDNE